MQAETFEIGDSVAWTLLDGNTMAGEITDFAIGAFMVKRVDGSVCRVSRNKVRRATYGDYEDAIAFYANIGK